MQKKGIVAALASALFLGMAPVFGKLAIRLGLPWQYVVTIRTVAAAMLLLLVLILADFIRQKRFPGQTQRSFFYIYPAGLLGCVLAGGINGIGSLFYYAALGRIDASLGQLLYSLYPWFLVVWLWIDRQPPTRLTVFRLAMVVPAVYLLTKTPYYEADIWGVVMMLIAASLYALHLPINQRVLFDMPAPTVTLYTLLSMSAVVIPAALILSAGNLIPAIETAWPAVLGLTLVTFLSRLTLFLGVKHLGGLQTAILGLGELLITIVVSHVWLGERLNGYQWAGALMLIVSLSLVSLEKPVHRTRGQEGWLSWLRPPGLPEDLTWPHD